MKGTWNGVVFGGEGLGDVGDGVHHLHVVVALREAVRDVGSGGFQAIEVNHHLLVDGVRQQRLHERDGRDGVFLLSNNTPHPSRHA